MGLHLVVLAGGSGTRLWPLSRAAIPKHLLPLGRNGESLLRATVERVLPLGDSVHVVTAASQVAGCAAVVQDLGLGPGRIIAEPVARGTGPALGLATRWIARQDPAAVICSVHADADIADDDAYRASLEAAAGWAHQTDGLVCVGLVPTYPSTGLGYVATGVARPPQSWSPAPRMVPVAEGEAAAAAAAALPAFASPGFVEKPPIEVATHLVAEGTHLWNTGLFAWPAASFESEVAAVDPELDTTLGEVVAARATGDESLASARYESLGSIAVEPLVFERASKLTVVRAAFGWSDVGSFADLHGARVAAGQGDADDNVVSGDALMLGAVDCFVAATGGRTVAVAGATGLIVVDTGDAVLVVPADRVQMVREVVDHLRAEGRTDLL